MIEDIRNIKSEKKDLRKFGITVGLVLLVISGFLFWKEKESFQIFSGIGITLFLIAIAIPVVLKPIYLMWMIFATVLGWIMTRVILSSLFFLIITPIGLIAKVFGERFIERRCDLSIDSYWNYHNKNNDVAKNYENQF